MCRNNQKECPALTLPKLGMTLEMFHLQYINHFFHKYSSLKDMKFTMGAHDLSAGVEDGRMECRPSKAIQHPKFNGSYHDIMLVKIKCNVC